MMIKRWVAAALAMLLTGCGAGAAQPEKPQPEQNTEPFTVAWMSDTQEYAANYPQIFESMTGWVAEQAKAGQVGYAIHTGDVVNDYDHPDQWELGHTALSALDGIVPLFLVAGNRDIDGHEHSYGGYMGLLEQEQYEKLPTFGGYYKDGVGRYDLLEIAGEPVIVAGLGYSVESEDIDWLNGVLARYADRTAILCFHGFLEGEDGYTSDGKQLERRVVAQNPNVKLVLCGHRAGTVHTAAEYDDDGDGKTDRTVWQLMNNYQDEEEGGEGYLQLLTFDPAAGELRVRTYSPWLDDYDHYGDGNENEEFTLPWLVK